MPGYQERIDRPTEEEGGFEPKETSPPIDHSEVNVVALFASPDEARRAIHALRDRGLPEDRIAVLTGSETPSASSAAAPSDFGRDEGVSVTTAGDAAHGAALGASVGAGLGLVGALGSILVPGFGLVLASEVLAKALGLVALTAAGGAVAGGLTGYLVDLGIPAAAVPEYTEVLQHGGVLVALHGAGERQAEEIRQIFVKYNGRAPGASAVERGGTTDPSEAGPPSPRFGNTADGT